MASLCKAIIEFAPDAIMQTTDLTPAEISKSDTFCGVDDAVDARYADMSRLRVREPVLLTWKAADKAFVVHVPVRIPVQRCTACNLASCSCRYVLEYLALEDVQPHAHVASRPHLASIVGNMRRDTETLLAGAPLTVSLQRSGGSHTMDFLRSWDQGVGLTSATAVPVRPVANRLSDRHWTVFRPSYRINDGLLALARLSRAAVAAERDEKFEPYLRRVLTQPTVAFTVGTDVAAALLRSRVDADAAVMRTAYTALVLLAKHASVYDHDGADAKARQADTVRSESKDPIVDVLSVRKELYAFRRDVKDDEFKIAHDPLKNIQVIARTAEVAVSSMYADVHVGEALHVAVHPPSDAYAAMVTDIASASGNVSPCLSARLVYVVKRA